MRKTPFLKAPLRILRSTPKKTGKPGFNVRLILPSALKVGEKVGVKPELEAEERTRSMSPRMLGQFSAMPRRREPAAEALALASTESVISRPMSMI